MRPNPLTILAIAALGVFMAFVDATIVNIAFPDIARSFPGGAISALSWVLNAYNIVFAAFLVAAGRLADLLGRRRVFIGGLALFTVASALCAVAPSRRRAGRVPRCSRRSARRCSSPPRWRWCSRRSRPSAAPTPWRCSTRGRRGSPPGIGPSLGGLLVAVADWRLVFLVNLPIGRRRLRARAPPPRREPRARPPPHARPARRARCFALAIGAARARRRQGRGVGLDEPARARRRVAAALALGASSPARCRLAPLADRRPRAAARSAPSRSPTRCRSSPPPASTATRSSTSSSSPAVWRYSVLEAGLAMTPGPFVAAAVAGPDEPARRALRRTASCSSPAAWSGARAVFWLVDARRADAGLRRRVAAGR